jgi:hypothetical protein
MVTVMVAAPVAMNPGMDALTTVVPALSGSNSSRPALSGDRAAFGAILVVGCGAPAPLRSISAAAAFHANSWLAIGYAPF